MWRVCRRIVGNDHDADDATQEALIKVIRHIGAFDQRSKFSTWTYRIASNSALDVLRKRKRHMRAVSLDRGFADGPQREVEDPSASERIEQFADLAAFDDALQQLDEDFRVPLVLRDVATLSYREIADQLELPVGTVKSRIARARQSLLELLNSPGNQPVFRDVKPTGPPDPL